MGIKYDMYKAMVGRETKALKAVAEAILIRASKLQMKPTRRSAGIGICNVGCT